MCFPSRTLGALGKMLYDSKMMKSFSQSFAFSGTLYLREMLRSRQPAELRPAALRAAALTEVFAS